MIGIVVQELCASDRTKGGTIAKGHPERGTDDPADVQSAVPTTRWSPTVRRSYPRFSVTCAVTLQPANGDTTLAGTTVNVSRGGALIRTECRLDEAKRHLVVFLPDEKDPSFGEHTCPECGNVFGGRRLQRMAVWARVLRQGRGGGRHDSWASAVEFESLIELGEEESRDAQ